MDSRIFYKECRSLVKAGYDVTLIANHNKKEEVIGGVKIISFPLFKNRLTRMLFSPLRMFFLARKQEAAIYHFHDPELVITGLLLKCSGAKVIFDVHEDIVKQIKIKKFLLFSSLLSRLFVPLNYLSAKCFHLVLAEHSYEKIYKKHTRRYRIVLNMPDIGFFEPYSVTGRSDCRGIFYIGRVTKLRGIDVMVRALHILKKKKIDVTMHVVGYIDPALKEELENLDYFAEIEENIIFYGKRTLEEGYEIAKKCFAGLSVLKPVENYLHSYSTKVFEYMAVSLPVITSDFPLYKDVVEVHGCGFCIDPGDPDVLANSIIDLLTNKDKAGEMGLKGREAAIKEFNWEKEEKKLLEMYQARRA